MFSMLARAFASLSLALKQPLESFCDLETSHGDALVTKAGNYATWICVDGMQRTGDRTDFARVTEAMRLELSGALEARGHAIAGWYISDPDAALREISISTPAAPWLARPDSTSTTSSTSEHAFGQR
jgi:intracellular multiplication protein IcmB